ncbi:MAG TPA: bifunctional salicylyl-CoA 5-hydroxylase/oxidoreductase [Gemmatimonas aurantiaca]|uniref:2-amninobenzoyl-CoA monooxygenase/reductase n=2 Tax=Gemmatimonas aurantiaca TaxID=173480 RepID=C1ACU1_GEMAT|nr:bifunctional salicylyl-CoA 5-hydroxylase/oxidoreductase [Gemmatimonas aurantiaca]BAH40318.1 2-amninobenzoyl-CoA monooxygenase/reductase [Gemmatimonas aurantiaca T-27]HCT57672.1 bifunctional salicylyl-CoA 5-hydroxylase/oxidoreductase [Gemmatimonas aurantiaca]
MRIVCIGGGPAGLYFALLMKRLDPRHHITVVERNRPYDTFGWGVVFSDATMDTMRRWDADTADAIEQSFSHWDDIELRFKGRNIRSGGHGFVGIGRKRLLNILQARCEALGVELRFEQEVDSDLQFPDADLIIASDGINSKIRTVYAETFKPDIVVRPNRFIWLGTPRRFEAFTFDFQRTEHGWFQAHIYQFDEQTSTCIVECPEDVWRAHGLDTATQEESVAFCERLFSETLNGSPLLSNARHQRGSAWLNFQRVVCEQWWLRNANGSHVVLLGDAVHTAHFAIGSGTKLALEDAVELVRQFQRLGDQPQHIPEVLSAFQEARRIETLRIQNAAWNAMEWFEVCGARYCDQLEPEQFMYSLLTRSQRISHENLRVRDREWLEGYERWFAARAQVASVERTPPMFTPYTVRSVTLKNRVMVSPMAQYSAVDGVAGEFHLVHLGARALGGAALVMAEMTCPSPDARITPGCPGLWNDRQEAAWRRIVNWVHDHTDARMALQLGHSGAKGSTRRGWDGTDLPLPEGGNEPNWPLVSASPQAYLPGVSAMAREITRAEMTRVRDEFAASTHRAIAAGFDWVELHCAHGYLLSSFISPLTNQRTDEYGGSLANRLRYPLEVFTLMRSIWPQHLPMSVRISAHDWVEGGITPADAVEIARAFADAGADLIDCSSGQVSKRERPTYGRMFQTPFADRIRQEAGIDTIAVGAISEADHVNSIIAAGRADLCAVARPHLANPAWTLTEAARIGYTAVAWPPPYERGKPQLEAGFARAAAVVTPSSIDGFDAKKDK